MEIQYHLSEEDVVKFNLYHVKNSRIGKNSLRWQRIFSPVIFLLFAYFLTIFTELEAGPLYATFVVTAILWVIFYPKYFYFHITRQVRKMLREGKNEGLVGDHEMRLTKAGITDSSSTGETKLTWQGISEIHEDADYFFLYNSSVSAYILPKRYIDEPEQFREYLYKRLAK